MGAEQIIPMAATLSRMYVNVGTNASTTNVTYTLFVNGVATALQATATALTTGTFSDLVNSVAVSQGDKLVIQISPSTTGSCLGNISMRVS